MSKKMVVLKVLLSFLVLGIILPLTTAEIDLTASLEWAQNSLVGAELPNEARILVGNERVILHVEDQDWTLSGITKDNKIESIELGEIENPTLHVYTTTATISELLASNNQMQAFLQAKAEGKVRLDPVGVTRTVKFSIASLLSRVFGVSEGSIKRELPSTHTRPLPETSARPENPERPERSERVPVNPEGSLPNRPACTTNEECGAGMYCRDGYCDESITLDEVLGYVTGENQNEETITLDELMIPITGANHTEETDEERTHCSYTYECEWGEKCLAGWCFDYPQFSHCDYTYECAVGQKCIANRCVDTPEFLRCDNSFDCPVAEKCLVNRCIDVFEKRAGREANSEVSEPATPEPTTPEPAEVPEPDEGVEFECFTDDNCLEGEDCWEGSCVVVNEEEIEMEDTLSETPYELVESTEKQLIIINDLEERTDLGHFNRVIDLKVKKMHWFTHNPSRLLYQFQPEVNFNYCFLGTWDCSSETFLMECTDPAYDNGNYCQPQGTMENDLILHQTYYLYPNSGLRDETIENILSDSSYELNYLIVPFDNTVLEESLSDYFVEVSLGRWEDATFAYNELSGSVYPAGAYWERLTETSRYCDNEWYEANYLFPVGDITAEHDSGSLVLRLSDFLPSSGDYAYEGFCS